MSLALLGQRGPRLTLVNVVTSARLVAQAHPATIGWTLGVAWPHHEVPGRGNVVLQYGLSQNAVLSAVELMFDRRLPESAGGTRDLIAVQGFLTALTQPVVLVAGVAKAPPPVLVVWPGLLSLEAVVTSLAFEHRDIAADGQALLLVATLALETVPKRSRPAWGTA